MSFHRRGESCWCMYYSVETADILDDEERSYPRMSLEAELLDGGVEPDATLSVSSLKGNIDEIG